MRFRHISIALLVLFIAGCSSATVRYRMTFDEAGKAKRSELLEASKRVISRRLSRLSAEQTALAVEEEASGSVLVSLPVKDAKVREELTAELTAPFSLNVMLSSGSGGDLYVEEQGWFTNTGIAEKDVLWVVAGQSDDEKGTIDLEFTDEGRSILEKIARENVGGVLGLFVRNRLMSKMQIDSRGLREKISIAGIPSPEIAGIFADDVNTGLHVTFSLQ